MNVQLVVEHIRCDKTTELGHDEVYMIIGGSVYDANNTPTPINGRPPDQSQGADADPAADGHFTAWDCNDSGQMQDKYLNAVVFTVDVPPGGHVVLNPNFLESDGTALRDILAVAANFESQIIGAVPGWGPKVAEAITRLGDEIKRLLPSGSGDDQLGTLSFEFTNQDGVVWVSRAIFGSTVASLGVSGVGIAPYRNSVRLTGDGSNYTINLRFDGAQRAQQNAHFVSQVAPPATMPAGTTAAVSVTMQNTGSLPWRKAEGYRLGSQAPQDNTTWGIGRVELPVDVVAVGQTVTFNFTVKAPPPQGAYFAWRMVDEMVEWFGETVSVSPYPIALNRAVTLKVSAVSPTGSPVNGQVLVDGTVVGATGVPFTHTFVPRRVGPLGNQEFVYPTGLVRAQGYWDEPIDFGFGI